MLQSRCILGYTRKTLAEHNDWQISVMALWDFDNKEISFHFSSFKDNEHSNKFDIGKQDFRSFTKLTNLLKK